MAATSFLPAPASASAASAAATSAWVVSGGPPRKGLFIFPRPRTVHVSSTTPARISSPNVDSENQVFPVGHETLLCG